MQSKYTSDRCCVFPVKSVLGDRLYRKKYIAILIHIHYLDTIEYYMQWILNIPDGIDVYISTSERDVEKKCKDLLNGKRLFVFIYKENRGRDVSAFLVAAREELVQYEYIGFIHDKRAHTVDEEIDVNEWIYSLWHNMLASKNYVQCIIDYFDKNSNVGLLIPPIHLGKKLAFAICDIWGNNFENVVSLLKRIKVNIQLDEDEYPMTIGTVFWAKTIALRKLLLYPWTYEDFPQEPLALDGTISHAVERSLEYIVRDAGFETMWIMSDEYAAYQYENMRFAMKDMLTVLREFYGIGNLCGVDKIKHLQKAVSKYRNTDKTILVYGAGVIGKCVNKVLQDMDIKIKAHVTTSVSDNVSDIHGIQVVNINELSIDDGSFFIVAVSKKSMADEIKNLLLYRGVLLNNIYCW